MSKKKIRVYYDFDSPQLQLAWNQLMAENYEGMQMGLKSILSQVGVKSDPAIHIKDDGVIFKTVNTDKGPVLTLVKRDEKGLVTKDYKLVPNDWPYLVLFNGKLTIFWKRGGEADESVGTIETISQAVENLHKIDDPKVVQERIRQQDIKQGIIDEDGNPLPQKEDPAKKIQEAIDQVTKGKK